MSEVALTIRDDGIAIIALDAAERRNALSQSMLSALEGRLGEAGEADAAAIVLVGAGRVFSAGADLSEIGGTIADLAIDDAVGSAAAAIAASPGPVLCAIDGPCVGAGAELALACDVRVIGRSAWVHVPATTLGILYNPASLASLGRKLTPETLARLFLLAERFTGAEAVAAGLAARVVDDGAALEAALAMAAGAAAAEPAARIATTAALRALAAGTFRPEDHEVVRRTLLSTPERAERVRTARARLGLPTTTTDKD